MKLEELADLMGKSVDEIKIMLEQNDVIELKLTESNKNKISRKDDIGISEL